MPLVFACRIIDMRPQKYFYNAAVQAPALKKDRMMSYNICVCPPCATLVLQVHTPVFYAVVQLDDAPKVSLT